MKYSDIQVVALRKEENISQRYINTRQGRLDSGKVVASDIKDWLIKQQAGEQRALEGAQQRYATQYTHGFQWDK